jgi:hypothetical protein
LNRAEGTYRILYDHPFSGGLGDVGRIESTAIRGRPTTSPHQIVADCYEKKHKDSKHVSND